MIRFHTEHADLLTAPYGFQAGDANLRRYVGNNATNGVDPTGLVGAPVAFLAAGLSILPSETATFSGGVAFVKIRPVQAKQGIGFNPSSQHDLVDLLSGDTSGSLKAVSQSGITVSKDYVRAVNRLSGTAWHQYVDFGAEFELVVHLDNGKDPREYPIVQYVTETVLSTKQYANDKQRAEAVQKIIPIFRDAKIGNTIRKLDTDYFYPETTRNQEKRTINVYDKPVHRFQGRCQEIIDPKSGDSTFVISGSKDLDAVISRLKNLKSAFAENEMILEVTLETQIRQVSPDFLAIPGKQNQLNLGGRVKQLAERRTPVHDAIIGVTAPESQELMLSTLLGVFTWGYRVGPDFSVTPIKPVWKENK